MSSLSPKDRVSLCIFSYADGRRCRLPRASQGTPRIDTHPHLCHYHAEKESRAATADKLAKDLSAFFSGHYVSANDVSSAVARLIPAVVRGDIKPRTARTVAYLAQTLLQSIHLAQSEFKDAFGPDALRKSVRTGITSNHDRLFPPEPQPEPTSEQAAPPVAPPSVGVKSVGTRLQPVPSVPPVATPAPVPSATPVPSLAANTTPAPTTQPPTQQPPTENPSPTAPPPRPPRPPSPHQDPYAIRYDADRYHLREEPYKLL